MSAEATARIRAAIEDHGPITFAEFMEHALYGPGGFYETPPVGAEGHFVTSPHVHPVFADLLRFAFGEMREALGDPEPFRLVEVGAGDGTLARQLLSGFAEADRSAVDYTAVDYTAVEISEGARETLARLPVRVAAAIEELAPMDHACVFANELLDNLPFRRVRRSGDEIHEIRVGLENGRLIEVLHDCDDEIAALMPQLPYGADAAVPTEALRFVERLAARLRSGYVLLIDYGSTDGSSAGEPHGYRGQRVLRDVLDDPGSADITAGVDIQTIALRAASRGLQVLGSVTQRNALLTLGFERWNRAARDAQSRFLADRSGEAARVWESRSRASLLVDPAGLGRLSWLLLATEGLPTPAWMDRAVATEGLSPD